MPTDLAATNAFHDNPIGFLANAMILPPTQNASNPPHSEHLGLVLLGQGEPVTGTWKARMGAVGGPLVPLYQVVRAPVGEAYFRSYIADYHQGQTTFTTLGTNQHARFCFTANMNGCTFGRGTQADPNAPLVVSHGNAANAGPIVNLQPQLQPATKSMLQIQIQYARARDGHGVGGRVYEPEHYRIGNRMSVTFGHRTPGTVWVFHTIHYERVAGGTYVSYGVGPMITNAIL